MSIPWLILLVIYGFVCGWEKVDPLSWWLLVPMFLQDQYDMRRKR